MVNFRHVSLLRAGFALCCALAVPAMAAEPAWPNRPIRLVVPFVAGGGADVAARLIALKLQERLGQPLIVENKAGGNTLIGVQEVLRAQPDGYTLLWSIDQTFVLNPALYEKLPYDPKEDFTPVSMAVVGPNAVVARSQPKDPASVADLVARGKSRDAELNIGAAAIVSQILVDTFNDAAGTHARRVPFKGSAEVAQALMAGTVDAAFDGIAPYAQFVKSGRARFLAVSSARRFSGLPDVPTLDELGFKGIDMSVWFAIVGPAGMPAGIAQRVAGAVEWAVRQPDVTEKLLAFGFEPAQRNDPDTLRAQISTDLDRYGPIIRKLGFKLD
ncbi:Tripartite tricarboxylate transporter family receptor [Pigmentiphaga humi]|uniref:Tripartite tricarboxylate transporter family receptor n=2 Tax=Pigmentiphaga humi TaxID=2478468 RepID=A0A3P4AZ73_9BURK|nr:Tripartite tricarboxylate transporter family receptor [Pigmentiphaga humi]